MRLYFNSDKAWNFLLAHSFVYTLRVGATTSFANGEFWRNGKFTGYTGSKNWVYSVDQNGETELGIQGLDAFVYASGFTSKHEWLGEAVRLNGEQKEWNVYLVRMTKEERNATST